MFYYFGVGLDGTVGQRLFAGAVDFGDACLLDNVCSVGRSDTGTGKNDDPPCGLTHKGSKRVYALFGRRLATGSEYAVTSRGDDLFERFERVLPDFVKSPMEGHLHWSGQLYNLTGTASIDMSIGGEKSHYDGMGTELTALLHFATKGFIFLR